MVTPVFGSKIRNSHGNCGKKVAALNATLIFSADNIPDVDAVDATSMEDDDNNDDDAELMLMLMVCSRSGADAATAVAASRSSGTNALRWVEDEEGRMSGVCPTMVKEDGTKAADGLAAINDAVESKRHCMISQDIDGVL